MNQPQKHAVRFVLGVTRIDISAELRPMNTALGRTIDLEPMPEGAMALSLTATFADAGGRLIDELETLAGEHDAPDVTRLCQLWRRWRLADMQAGTRAQAAHLNSLPELPPTFEGRQAALAAAGLDPDRGYGYGSGWLGEPVPPEAVAEVWRILYSIDGRRFGEPVTRDDLANLPEIDEGADTLDSRDIIARLEGFAAFLADLPEDERTPERYDPETDPSGDRGDEVDEYAALKSLVEDGESYGGDWRYGTQLISENYFEEYAKEMAEDIGAIGKDAPWPASHIDWSEAAEALKQDYTELQFKGKSFWLQ